MTIDLPTLMLGNAFVSVLCSAVLVSVWWQIRERAALWWATAHLAAGIAVVLFAAAFVGKLPPLFLGSLTLLLIASALTWSGVRTFHGRSILPLPIAAGLLVWTGTAAGALLSEQDWALTVSNTLIILCYGGATLWELTRNKGESLRAGGSLMVLIGLQMLVLSFSIPDALTGTLPAFEVPPLASIFGLIHFEGVAYAIGTTVFFVALMKERTEKQHLHDALTDPLTGLSNRRGFLELAERMAERCKRRSEPIAVAIFDLDHFKLVNDTYGHAFGDTILRLFARVAGEALRPGDIISRGGGEEFFAILPAANVAEGRAVAERVRKAFAEAAQLVDGRAVAATVSAGVMVDHADTPLAMVLEKADQALYAAKLAGRNRVESSFNESLERPYPRLVRVA